MYERMLTKRNTAVIVLVIAVVQSSVFALIKGSPHDLSPLESKNPCLFCHTPHGALPQTPSWSHKLSDAVYTIYQSSSLEAKVGQPTGSSKLCLSCHDGSVAATNLQIDLAKASRHDVVRYDGVHDLKESSMTMPMHVECVDCHNPHATRDSQSQVPLVPGAIRDVTGTTSSGAFIQKAQYEYEVCFKCHADNTNRINSRITRRLTQSNTRLEFAPSNPSFHPVVSPGANRDVPSLRSPLTVVSMIYCTDCHNSDSASATKGPHGSNYPYLLAHRYETSDFTQES